MPSKTLKQAKFMAACAHGAKYKDCPPDDVSTEFNKADAKTGILKVSSKQLKEMVEDINVKWYPFKANDFRGSAMQEKANPNDVYHKPVKSKTHANTIHDYTKFSWDVNTHLYKRAIDKTHPKDPEIETRIRKMDSVMNNKENHVGHEMHVHSGLGYSPKSIIDAETKRTGSKPKHVHLHMHSYTSTTDDEGVAKYFAEQDENLHKHILHLHVPKDHPMVSAMHHSDSPNEREFILHRGSKVKLNTAPIVDHDGTHHWFGKVVGRS